MKLILAFLIALTCTIYVISAEDVKSIMTKTRWGVEAGTQIFNALSAESLSTLFKSVGNIAGQISPFLAAIGPVLHLITLFIPTGPSPEMVYMKEQFAIVDAKFGQVFNRLDEVKQLIEKESLRNMYSNAESKIKDLSHLLSNFHNATKTDDINFWKNKFLTTYSTSLEEATRRLWRGMTETADFNRNIPLTVLSYTENHRLKTQNIMKKVTNLILKGAQIIISYNELTGNINGSKKEQEYWNDRVKDLVKAMKTIDDLAVSKFKPQYVKDIDKKLADLHGVSNKKFTDTLINFLKEKYEWRYWFVLTFEWVNYGKAKQSCNDTVFRYKVHGRNLYVVNVPYDSWPISSGVIRTFGITPLNYENCRYGCWDFTSWSTDAVTLYNRYRFYKDGCRLPGIIMYNGFSNNDYYRTTRQMGLTKDVRRVTSGRMGVAGYIYIFIYG